MHTPPPTVCRTREDEKVRPSHAANDGVIFAWDAPPPTGHPGEDFGCRCIAEPYYGNLPVGTRLRRPDADEPIEAVYPEMLIIPLLRTPRLIAAWRVWAELHGPKDCCAERPVKIGDLDLINQKKVG